MTDPLIARANELDRPDFVASLGALYEHSPWVASETWPARPFADRQALHDAMQAAVRAGSLESHSAGEQQGLGLDRLSDEQYARFDGLNTAYRTRFGFPFIIAVRAQTRDSVLDAFVARLRNTLDQERETALAEIGRIAWFRLQDLA